MGGLSDVMKAVGLSGGDIFSGGSLGMMGLSTATAMGDTIYNAYAQKKADKKAYERQIDLMDMQNAYNTPAAQMQRYLDAGLNPNLIYSQSNLSASPAAVSHGSPQPRSNITGSIMQGLTRAQVQEQMELQHRYDVLKMSQDLQLGESQVEQSRLSNALTFLALMQETDVYNKYGITKKDGFYERVFKQLSGIFRDLSDEYIFSPLLNYNEGARKGWNELEREMWQKIPVK